MIKRTLSEKIETLIGGNKAIIIMGPRQVGKSTLLNNLFANKKDVMFLNGDEMDVRLLFENISSTRLSAVIGKNKILVIDEAQRIENIGLKLKLITDNINDAQVIATGNSSFDLASKVNESLAGRKREFKMFGLSFAEMVNHTSLLIEKRMIPQRMLFGYYPEVVTNKGEEKAVLKELVDSYLYKDILTLDSIKKSEKLIRLVQALALQIGSQVSYNELSNLVGLDQKTVEKYIDILEKSFIVFRLSSFSRNARNELKMSRKIYFYDNGIRNAVLGNFSQIESRLGSEVGALWENYLVSERVKYNAYRGFYGTSWFWRTQQQKEIDYLEDEDGILSAYEFKWNSKVRAKIPKQFSETYKNYIFKEITPENIEEFLLF